MRKSILRIFGLAILSLVLTILPGCYQPVANTSEKKLDLDEPETISDTNTATENMNKEENLSEMNTTDEASPGDSQNPPVTTAKAEGFRGNLTLNLNRNGQTVSDIADESNTVEKRILDEYGAIFLTKAIPPTKAMFTSESEVSAFQSRAGSASASIGGASIELQPMAMKALQDAIAEAKQKNLSITPRDGAEAGKRSYGKTLSLWKSRFEPALKHWRSKGKLTDGQISRLQSLPIKEQVREVLELEKQGIYFSTYFNNSIIYSVAAPGTSQHISMLAFDVEEYKNKKVREVLAVYGWFRTVQNDEPHFTYLGYSESELPALGLKKVSRKGGGFWVPDI
jgi:hypothetical protein